jgi:drug/metabolite transporter (DMT)-like permease
MKLPSTPGRWRAVISVLGAVVIWSSSYVATKVGVTELPPISFGTLRFAFAAFAAGVLALGPGRLERILPREMLGLAFGGLIGITCYFSLQNLGVRLTSASEATLLVAFFPIIATLMEAAVSRTRPSARKLAGAAVALAGIYAIASPGLGEGASSRLMGDALLLATGFAWGAYNLATKKIVERRSAFTIVFWQTIFGATAFLPLALVEVRQWKVPSVATIASAAFLGVFCSAAAFLLYGYGLKALDPGTAVGLMNLVPALGLALAAFALGERVTPAQVAGGACVVGGVILGSLGPRRVRGDGT